MRISGAGKGGALIAVAGAVAIGMTGCSTNSGGAASPHADAVRPAAAGAGTTSTSTSTSASSGSAAGDSTGTSAGDTAGSHAVTPLSEVVHSSPASNPVPTSPASTWTRPPTHPAKAPAPKPSTPPKTSGANWLAGVPIGQNKPGALDPRCMTGRVICIDMSTHTLLWVINGKPQYGMDVRFGDVNNPTRKGKFDIYLKMEHCISTIYHTSMPDAMFFSGGEAVHFSIDFATYGYAHHSHGCVNVRDRAAVARLFADTRLGDSVVVY